MNKKQMLSVLSVRPPDYWMDKLARNLQPFYCNGHRIVTNGRAALCVPAKEGSGTHPIYNMDNLFADERSQKVLDLGHLKSFLGTRTRRKALVVR